MATLETIQDFVGQKKIAVVGVSRTSQKFGAAVYRELKTKGYTVYPVNPHADIIEGVTCYKSLQALPEPVDGVVIVVKPEQTDAVVRDVKEAGITRVWMQQGSQSTSAIEYCEENGIEVVSKQCILMFAEPVTSIHKFHRFFKTLFGGIPKATA